MKIIVTENDNIFKDMRKVVVNVSCVVKGPLPKRLPI